MISAHLTRTDVTSAVLLQMPGTERKDLLQLMTTKGLRVRTDTYEILLQTAANIAGLPS